MQTRAAARKAQAEAIDVAQHEDVRSNTPEESTAENELRILSEQQRQFLLTPPGDIPIITTEHRELITTPLGDVPRITTEQRQLLPTPPGDSPSKIEEHNLSESPLGTEQDVTEKNLSEPTLSGRKRNRDGKPKPESAQIGRYEQPRDPRTPQTPELVASFSGTQMNGITSPITNLTVSTLAEASSVETGADVDIPDTTSSSRYELRARKVVALKTGAISAAVQRIWSTPSASTGESDTTTSLIRSDDDVEPQAKRPRHLDNTAVTANSTDAEVVAVVKQRRKARKTAENPYGLSPGETPYPEWPAPTPQQCQEIYDILIKVHDDVKFLSPNKIPAPSLNVAGCGEVPSVLDGLIRTVLSGSTTFDSADKMLQALVKRFGVVESGIGKGSVNWNHVRTAAYDDVYAQLKNGGLGGVKARNIQTILNMVYEENRERCTSYIREPETNEQTDIAHGAGETRGQKELEILKADKEMLSLDHMHGMETHEAIEHFVRYPGVGVKTAACVVLFSLQRPCFAVDTHVFRLSKWLGWVPKKTNEDGTFSHLEVRCPANLKYGLHQLFIRHGKTCYRCNDKSFSGTEAWKAASCPLEHLIDRFTKRVAKPTKPKAKNGKTEKIEGADDIDKLDEIDASKVEA